MHQKWNYESAAERGLYSQRWIFEFVIL